VNTPPDWTEDEQEMPTEIAHDLSSLRPDDPRLSIEVLRAAGEGVLPPHLEAAAQEHLARSAAARALLRDLDDLSQLDAAAEARLFARISQEAARVDTTPTAWLWRWSAAAAIGTIVIAGAALWMTAPNRRNVAAPQVVASAPASSGVAAPAAPATASFQLPLERPDLRISLKAMTWRGATNGNPVLAALKPAFDAFRTGDFARADVEFTAVSKRYPDLVEVALYQGVSRLFIDNSAGALESLRHASTLADPAFAADVAWYLAVAEERAGNLAAARAGLLAACRADPSRNERACRGADQLK
jgi:hypothetical protein